MALIPDDDDEELVEKAKANRRSRLAEDKKTAKQFVQVEDQAQGDLVQVRYSTLSVPCVGLAQHYSISGLVYHKLNLCTARKCQTTSLLGA